MSIGAAQVARLLETALPQASLGRWSRGPAEDELPLVAPRSSEEWSELVRLAGREGLRLLPLGGGSKAAWLAPERLRQCDLVVSTRAWNEVTAYEPGDGTLTARAGATMASLAKTVAAGGHHLSPAVPRAAEASLGGVIASGQSGFDRLRFGPIREQLLGTSVLLADGAITKSGGALVKNVTGYDLHRLYCGSGGTLCVILEASLRLAPLPGARAVLTRGFTGRTQALNLAQRIRELAVRPWSLQVFEEGKGLRLVACLAGRGEVVEWEERSLRELDSALEPVPADSLERELLLCSERAGTNSRGEASWPALALTCRPSQLEACLEPLEGDVPVEKTLIEPGLAQVSVWLGECAEEELLLLLGRLQETPASVRCLSSRIPLGFDRWQGLADGAREMMRNLRAALDPTGVFASSSQ